MYHKTIASSLLFSTIRIDLILEGGKGVGTGFVYEHSVDDKFGYFVITNKHVIEDVQSINLFFMKGSNGEPILGQGYTLSTYERDWKKHPNLDIAVLPVSRHLDQQFGKMRANEIYFTKLDKSIFLSTEHYEELDIIENVSFFGYPIGLWDIVNALPIHRRGMTATPIHNDFDGKPQFLIDASIFPGSSGSPVYLLDVAGTYFSPKRKGIIVGQRIMFLGILTSGFCRDKEGKLRMIDIPITNIEDEEINEMIGLGRVLKATTILQFIEQLMTSG